MADVFIRRVSAREKKVHLYSLNGGTDGWLRVKGAESLSELGTLSDALDGSGLKYYYNGYIAVAAFKRCRLKGGDKIIFTGYNAAVGSSGNNEIYCCIFSSPEVIQGSIGSKIVGQTVKISSISSVYEVTVPAELPEGDYYPGFTNKRIDNGDWHTVMTDIYAITKCSQT